MTKSKAKIRAQRKKRLSRVESPSQTKSSDSAGLIPASLARRSRRTDATSAESPVQAVQRETGATEDAQRQMDEDPPVQAMTAEPERNEPAAADAQRLTVSRVDDPSEREAESVARQVAAGEKAPPISATPAAETSRASPADDTATQRRAEPDVAEPGQRQTAGGTVEPAVQRRADNAETQRQTTPEELPRQAMEKTGVQRQAAIETSAEPAMRRATNAEAGLDTAAAARAIDRSDDGRPLQPALRKKLESGIGADLSAVKVHDDSAAHQASDALNARAFTRGNDIYMSDGASENDVSLMAHEATHTVQQAGGSTARSVQRAEGAGEAEPATFRRGGSEIDVHQKRLTLAEIRVPAVKARRTNPPIKLRQEERKTQQVSKWNKDVGAPSDNKMQAKLQQAPDLGPGGGRRYYYLRYQGDRDRFLIGTASQVKRRARRPTWDKGGKENSFDVDHIHEYQLSGADDISNLWLWDSSANRSSGSKIAAKINDTIRAFLRRAAAGLGDKTPGLEEVRKNYNVIFKRARGGLTVAGEPAKFWTADEIKAGKHVDQLDLMSADEVDAAGLKGSPNHLAIFSTARGGSFEKVPWEAGSSQKTYSPPLPFYDNFHITKIEYSQNSGGTVFGDAFKDHEAISERPGVAAKLRKMPGVETGGSINPAGLKDQLGAGRGRLVFKYLSPISLTSLDLADRKGFVACARILPTVPLIKDAAIDLVIDGNDVYLSKLFDTSDFSFPGPVQVTGSSLEIRLGPKGLDLLGQADLEVERLGRGRLSASTRSGRGAPSGGFALAGEFEFDTTLFDPAKVDIKYEDGVFSGGGELGIKEGKIKGIRSASIKANVEGDRWSATGIVQPSVPGIEQGTLSLKYAPETGMEVAGSLNLTNQIPGIRGGAVDAAITRREGAEGWKLKASGSALPAIPGVTSSIHVEYDDGKLLASGTVGYQRGMLSGSVSLGVSNMPAGEGEEPQGEPTDTLSFFGHGSLSIQFTPWLKGTAAVTFKPDGQLEVVGEVSIPATVDVFEARRFDKQLLNVGIDLPIFGVTVPVIRKNIGIFLSINGGLALQAGIGPGQLRELGLRVTYNPDQEQDTRIEGRGKFVVPADAGLRLAISASLGAGIPVVEARAGLEIGGKLGVEGAAEADVEVNWTPSTGIVLDATARIHAEPKFRFDIAGFVLVEADVYFASYELYSKRWKLFEKEFGSGLRLGMTMPIHYEDDQPFQPSLDDIVIEKPDISPREVLGDVFDAIT